MIKEITNFVERLPLEYFSKNLELKEGLYMFLDIQEDSDKKPFLKNLDAGYLEKSDYAIYDKNSEDTPFFATCLEIQTNSIPVSPQKIFNPNKKIYNASCSPFALAFTKKNFEKYRDNKALLQKELSDQYFKTAEKYVPEQDHLKNSFRLFRNYLTTNLIDLLDSLEAYNNAKESLTVNIYMKNIDVEHFIESHGQYLGASVFNKDIYNEDADGILMGVSDSLSGFNDKKLFLQHKSALSGISYRVSQKDAQYLWKFFRLQANKQIPNPLPLFVDNDEANGEMISLHQSGQALSYTEIVQALLREYDRKELQNFYLLYFDVRSKKSKIIDLDFVPVFKYNVDGLNQLVEIFKQKEALPNSIQNVFDLQSKIINKIFNGHLVLEKKGGGLWLKYFDDIEPNPKYGLTDAIFHILQQYRKAFYDYIFKSRREAVTCAMFDDMMQKSILDDIRHDEEFNKHYRIREKLNIWFNLYNFFSQNQNREDMPNKTLEIKNTLKSVMDDENKHIQTDDEFAFASGQVIWKILVQSKSANRSHALLEPFLQKVSPEEFKVAIARNFDTYKHEFKFYPRKYGFDKLMSEVMGYEPEHNNMKSHLPMILAGYFADSLFKKEPETVNQ